MGRPISYEMQMMFVGSVGAFEEAMNTGSGISRLDFIQGYDFSFNIDRPALKQIGSDSFATRQTQFAPDVNFNIQYLLNDGWNEKYIGLDIPQGSLSNPFDTILSSTGDRNFYVSVAKNDGKDQNLESEVVNSNILSIGNAYISSYEISVAVNQLATVSCSFVGSNASVQDYETSKYLPSVNSAVTGQNAEDADKKFALKFLDNNRNQAYIPKATETFAGGCPYSKCKITPDFQSDGVKSPITFGFFDAVANNFQSMQFAVQFERKSLYGFGNNHPYGRKVQRPIVATLALSSLIDDFQAENLSKVFHNEGWSKSSILIEFFNLSDVKKFTISLSNLTLESYSLGARIGDRVLVDTNWTVEINNGGGSNLEMGGSYRDGSLDVTLVNESFSAPQFFSQIVTVNALAYAITKDGNLFSWGFSGQTPALDAEIIPRKVFNRSDVSLLADSYGYSRMFLDKNGKAWAWGDNQYGSIGDGTAISRSSPVSVIGNKTFCQIAVNPRNSFGVDKNATAWGWGRTPFVGINVPTEGSTVSPVQVLNYAPPYIPYTVCFCKISLGYDFALCVDQNGKAWAWGANNNAQLGIGTIDSGWAALKPVCGNKTFCKISGGYDHSLAIDKNGKAWAWGRGTIGVVGGGVIKSTPVAVSGNMTFCHISAGYLSSGGLDKNGEAWQWGSSISQYPAKVSGSKKTFCQIKTVGQFYYAIDNNNRAWGWGDPRNGSFGDPIFANRRTPTAIGGLTKTFCKVSTFIAIDKKGKAWAWGYNEYGSVGDGSTSIRCTPVSVYGNKTFCEIASIGADTVLAIDKNGKAWGWSRNQYGQLGDGTSIDKLTPVSVYGNRTFCKITGGGSTSIAIDKNGKAWGWGFNYYGQAGIGEGIEVSLTPMSIVGNKTFCQIYNRGTASFGIDKNGKAWGWGYNYGGELGIGAGFSSNNYSPLEVLGNKTFCQIFYGGTNSIGLDKNGKVWSWGLYPTNIGTDEYGNPLEFIGSPMAVCTNKTFCKIAWDGGSVLATDKNGRTWAWGSDYYNTLSIGGGYSETPKSINGDKTFNYINMDGGISAGIDIKGRLWTWGDFYRAKLGQGIPMTDTPVRIYNF